MSKSVYSYIGETWKKPRKGPMAELYQKRLIEWRRGESFVRVERPTRLDRARALGYRAKPGFVIVRAKVRRGSFRKRAIIRGRKAKKRGIAKITVEKNLRWIAEERVAKRYPNLEVLNSYWVAEDGKQKFFEVIMVDPVHPAIINDPKINWICDPVHKGRPYRGKTGAGKKARGHRKKGKGTERLRPSRQASLRGRRVRDRKRDTHHHHRKYA
jgi:large subunit ribosomal protein L15e